MKKYRFKPRLYRGIPYVTPQYVSKVTRRDRGICRKCGLNTVHLREALTYVYARCDTGERWVWWPLTFKEFRHAVGPAATWFPRHKNLFEIDHIHPRKRFGPDDISNLQTLCHGCHSQKSAIERTK